MTFSPTRRHALALIAGGASTLISACRNRDAKSRVDPWTALVVALGPWIPADRDLALHFTATLQLNNPVAPRGVALSKLADRLSEVRSAGRPVPFSTLSRGEQEVVEMLVATIYNSPQVAGYVRGEPPLGQCSGDMKRHTQSPAELGW